MSKRKLVIDELEVTTFTATPDDAGARGTVQGYGYATPVCTGSDSCAVSCPNYTCVDWTCARVPC